MFPGTLSDLVNSVRQQGLEDLVAKRRNSVHEPGLRSGAWQKTRINQGQEFVIGEYTIGGATFDALVFGYYEDDRLMYVRERETASHLRSALNYPGGSSRRVLHEANHLPEMQRAQAPSVYLRGRVTDHMRWHNGDGTTDSRSPSIPATVPCLPPSTV
jgi:hypothetical protein